MVVVASRSCLIRFCSSWNSARLSWRLTAVAAEAEDVEDEVEVVEEQVRAESVEERRCGPRLLGGD